MQARILLFHGQSGAGKTHLIRALRTSAHRTGRAYFGYAQMTPDVANYADYFLRRLVASLEKPYDPDNGGRERAGPADQSAWWAMPRVVEPASLDKLRDAKLSEASLAKLVLEHCRPDRRGARSSPARTSTSISCARCSTCSAPTRASTSACASISMATS